MQAFYCATHTLQHLSKHRNLRVSLNESLIPYSCGVCVCGGGCKVWKDDECLNAEQL